MDQLGAVLSRNTAAKYETIFEIIYSIEVKSTTWNGYFKCFVDILDCHRNCAVVSTNLDSLECRAASSKCMCLIKEREKLAIDYQLRVIFVVCIVQSLILFVTRPALVYAQLCGWKGKPKYDVETCSFQILRVCCPLQLLEFNHSFSTL